LPQLTFENLLPVGLAASVIGVRSAVSSTSIITGAPCYSRTEYDRDYEQWMAGTHLQLLPFLETMSAKHK
jgi:hypothetical protein